MGVAANAHVTVHWKEKYASEKEALLRRRWELPAWCLRRPSSKESLNHEFFLTKQAKVTQEIRESFSRSFDEAAVRRVSVKM